MSDPHRAVLDREAIEFFVKDQLIGSIDLLKELVDHGTDLIPRAYGNGAGKIKDICLLFVQLQQGRTNH